MLVGTCTPPLNEDKLPATLQDTDLKVSSENAWSPETVIKNLHFYPNLSCPRWFADTHAAVANGQLSPCFLLQDTTLKA